VVLCPKKSKALIVVNVLVCDSHSWQSGCQLVVSAIEEGRAFGFGGLFVEDRGWLAYIPPLLLASMAGSVAYFRYMRKDEPIPEVLVSTPPGQNAVEQLLALQQALAQLEALIQASNIMLLKTRALLLSAFPEVLRISQFCKPFPKCPGF
jgi:hypothetical protein